MTCVSKRWWVILSCLLALGIGVAQYAASALRKVHPLGASCSSCHLAGDSSTPENASLLIATQEVLCSECHRESMEMSHRSGFIPPPGETIPPQYPLDWKGEITCSTCHAVHSNNHGKLRGSARGPALCLGCHAQSFFDDMPDGGASLTPSGHLGIMNRDEWSTLDQYSVQCLNCHQVNGDVNLDKNLVVGDHGAQSHPIGRNYLKAEMAGGYRPMSFLSERIKLPNGELSCISCHEGYSRVHGKLVIEASNSKLCFECHNL